MAAAARCKYRTKYSWLRLCHACSTLGRWRSPTQSAPGPFRGKWRARGIDRNGERQSRDNAEHERAALDPNDEPACFESRGPRFERILRYPAFDVCFVLAVVSFSLAFISLILRCSVRRLIPSFLAAAVTFPLVVTNACKISLRSVS